MTDTPAPTATTAPTVTDTPAPTATTAPTVTETPAPTATTAPTVTYTPVPTATTAPTATDTPSPTSTTAPTVTDMPTPTATAAPGVIIHENGYASTYVINTTNEKKKYMLISANYLDGDEQVLSSVNIDEQTVMPGGYAELSAVDGDKVFLWDENMAPYVYNEDAEARSVGIAEAAAASDTRIGIYDKLLERHTAIHRKMFEGTRLTLCETEDEKADRNLTNSELNKKQQENKTKINKAWLERLYDNGRFGLICSSGYNTSRLGGIWVGNWMPDWSGDFTQDANVNLQMSAVNTMGLKDAAQSYITYILRQVSDWQINAKNIYGIDNAIMAGPRTDGDGNGKIYHTLAGYPFMYWNTGADWLIIPIYEYWQCYGNEKIPVGEGVDLTELTSVLDLDDADKTRIASEGFDLESDILAPLLTKLYNFWKGYTNDNYYISADGTVMHLNDGTTMSNSDKYMFTPGYSPENVPNKDGQGYNGAPSLAANTTMDISAAHDSMSMVRSFIGQNLIDDISLEDVNNFESKFPEYLYGSDGALKEWAVAETAETNGGKYEEHYNHRHVSHTYGAWPGYEAQDDYELRNGLASALDMRYTYNVSDNAQAHGHLHNALVEARIKRVPEYEKSLLTLIASNYEYAALMTSHNKGHASAFCTDNAFGLTGVVTEGLVYSDTGVAELLPALADDLETGEITDINLRTEASLDSLKWNDKEVTAKITSRADNNTIKLMCGEAWTSAAVDGAATEVQTDENGRNYIELTLNGGESKNVVCTLNSVSAGTYYIKNSDNKYLAAESYAEGAAVEFGDLSELWNITPTGAGKFEAVNTYSGRSLVHDEAGYRIYRNTDGKSTEISLEGLTLEKQKTETAGCVADEIKIEAVSEIPDEVSVGKTLDFEVVSYIPGAAISYGKVWKVEAEDNSPLSGTKFSGDSLYIGSDALGKTLKVYAQSPDGSCTSNEITVNVAEQQVKNVTKQCEDYEYGFGNFKLEGTNIGTINGRAVIKYKNIDFDGLLGINFTKSDTRPSKTTLYYDVQESEAKEYYNDYDKDSGDGKGQSSRRYKIDDIPVLSGNSLPEEHKISQTVAAAEGVSEVNVGIESAVSGVHDLYVVIDSNGHTWSGNYDYMTLTYAAAEFSKKLECENIAYGFGNFKKESGPPENIGTINNTAILKFANVDFDSLNSIDIVMPQNCNNDGKVRFYKDLIETEEKTKYTYDRDTTERDYRFRLDNVQVDESKAISAETQIYSSNADKTTRVELTDAQSGTGNLYMVINKVSGTWAGNYDYINLNYIGVLASRRTEFESYKYGYTTSGTTYKIDTRTDAANAGNCSGGARVHNIGPGGVQYFTYENVDFSGAVGMLLNVHSSGNATPIKVYADPADLSLSNTEDIGANANSENPPRLANTMPVLDGASLIAEGSIAAQAGGYDDIVLNVNENFPQSGHHNICIVMEGSGWKGDFDYFEIQNLK